MGISAPFGDVSATQDAWGNMYSDDGIFSLPLVKTLVIFSKSQSPNNQDKLLPLTCGHHQSPTKKPKPYSSLNRYYLTVNTLYYTKHHRKCYINPILMMLY